MSPTSYFSNPLKSLLHDPLQVWRYDRNPTLAESIRFFSLVSVLVGPHGAGIGANMIHMPEGSSVIELIGSPAYLHPCNINLANILGLRHFTVLANQPNKQGPMDFPNVTVLVSKTQELVDQWWERAKPDGTR